MNNNTIATDSFGLQFAPDVFREVLLAGHIIEGLTRQKIEANDGEPGVLETGDNGKFVLFPMTEVKAMNARAARILDELKIYFKQK